MRRRRRPAGSPPPRRPAVRAPRRWPKSANVVVRVHCWAYAKRDFSSRSAADSGDDVAATGLWLCPPQVLLQGRRRRRRRRGGASFQAARND